LDEDKKGSTAQVPALSDFSPSILIELKENCEMELLLQRCLMLLPILLISGTAAAQDKEFPSSKFDRDIAQQIEIYINSRPERNFKVEVASDAPFPINDDARKNIRYEFQKRMALSGHGVLFDIEGNRVELSADETLKLQDEMLSVLSKEEFSKKDSNPEITEKLNQLSKDMASDQQLNKLDIADAFAFRQLQLEVMAWKLPDPVRSDYRWRIQYLNRYIKNKENIISKVYWERWRDILQYLLTETNYMRDCANAGVPIPPDFAINGTAWAYQGNLTQNLLDPGGLAQVWTWAPPNGRGVCVALPRGTGGPDSLSGLICQSATTGNACFWDNILKSNSSRVPWATATMRIRDVHDGTILAENCTGCHKGNNVFLISPDDPTWCRILRGGKPGSGCPAPAGANAANLSSQLETVVNPIMGSGGVIHSRYNPLSGTPARPLWVNNAQSGCGGMCHLEGNQVRPPAPMPPNCGVRCN
jgi:hypothetical protein